MISEATNRALNRIQDHGPIQQITQLCLDGLNLKIISPTLGDEIGKARKLEFLTMNSCKLEDIEQLPALPSLLGLELMNNKYTFRNQD